MVSSCRTGRGVSLKAMNDTEFGVLMKIDSVRRVNETAARRHLIAIAIIVSRTVGAKEILSLLSSLRSPSKRDCFGRGCGLDRNRDNADVIRRKGEDGFDGFRGGVGLG